MYLSFLSIVSIILSKRTQAALWTVALVGGLGSMFSVTIFYHPEYKYSTLESAVYAGLHRLGWSFFTGWIVLACVTGYAGESGNQSVRQTFAVSIGRCYAQVTDLFKDA